MGIDVAIVVLVQMRQHPSGITRHTPLAIDHIVKEPFAKGIVAMRTAGNSFYLGRTQTFSIVHGDYLHALSTCSMTPIL